MNKKNYTIAQILPALNTGGVERGVVEISKAVKSPTICALTRAVEKDIDAVTISTPDHVHAPAAVYAMDRNKHVYVQKPLTHNIYEARLLTELARENKVVTQMGNQGASNPDQIQIQKWINENMIGTISKVNVWTNRPVWPQGIQMPKPDASLKPETLNWDQWLGPSDETPFVPNMHPFNWRGWWNFGTGALGCLLYTSPSPRDS